MFQMHTSTQPTCMAASRTLRILEVYAQYFIVDTPLKHKQLVYLLGLLVGDCY